MLTTSDGLDAHQANRRRAAADVDPSPPAAASARPARLACIACVTWSTGGSDLAAVLPVCRQLTPRIERHPGALLLDLTGSERLLLGRECRDDAQQGATIARGEWARVAERLHRLLAAAAGVDGAAPRVDVASSRAVAWLMAQTPGPACGPAWRAVAPQDVAAFLHPLPIEALLTLPGLAHLSGTASAMMALRQSGIQTMGHLARLAPVALQARFGALGLALARLAAGHDLTPLRVIVPAERLGARLRLDPPRELDQLAGTLDPLAACLARTLHQRRLEANDVLLVVCVDGHPPWRATQHLGHATADRGALLDHAHRLLGQLGADNTSASMHEPAFVSAIHLRVGALQSANPRQTAFWPPHRAQTAQQVAQRCIGRHERVNLWRAVLSAPDAVLPEERYTLQAHRAS